MRRKYLVVILTTHILSRINITFASQHGIETLMLHESSLELSVEETPNVDLSEKKSFNCTPCELNHHYNSTPNEYISAIHTGFIEFFDNNSSYCVHKNSSTVFARFCDVSSKKVMFSNAFYHVSELSNICHILSENSNVFVNDTALHCRSTAVGQCANNCGADDFERVSIDYQNHTDYLIFIIYTPNFIFNLPFRNCQSNAGEGLNSFNLVNINNLELAGHLNGIHTGLKSAQINDSIQLNIIDAIVNMAFTDNIVVYDGANLDFVCSFSKNCISLCAGILKGYVNNMADIRGRNHISGFVSSGMYSMEFLQDCHNVCAVLGFNCMCRKFTEKCACGIDFSNISIIFLPIKQTNIISFILSLVYSGEEKPSFNMIYASFIGDAWKSNVFLKENCIQIEFEYSFYKLKNQHAIHRTPDIFHYQKITETLPYDANVDPNIFSVALSNKELSIDSSRRCIKSVNALASAGEPPIYESADAWVANGNYSIFERSIVGSEDHIGAGADSYESYAGFCQAFFTRNLNVLIDDAPYVNPKTPEDNYKVVPQNDTILEFSIIESSDIAGLLMES